MKKSDFGSSLLAMTPPLKRFPTFGKSLLKMLSSLSASPYKTHSFKSTHTHHFSSLFNSFTDEKPQLCSSLLPHLRIVRFSGYPHVSACLKAKSFSTGGREKKFYVDLKVEGKLEDDHSIAKASKDSEIGEKEGFHKGEGSLERALQDAESSSVVQKAKGEEGLVIPPRRFLPPRDPSLFLIEGDKLTSEERKFQLFFATFPWLAFLFMLFFPFFLVSTVSKRLTEISKEMQDHTKDLLEKYSIVSEYKTIKFSDLLEIMESPFHHLIFLFHPDTFISQVCMPLIRDLASLLSRYEVPLGIAALDLSQADIPAKMRAEFPSSSAPHLQLIIPYAYEGEHAVQSYEGVWLASEILSCLSQQIPIPRELMAQAKELDHHAAALFESLFMLQFVDDHTIQEALESQESDAPLRTLHTHAPAHQHINPFTLPPQPSTTEFAHTQHLQSDQLLPSQGKDPHHIPLTEKAFDGAKKREEFGIFAVKSNFTVEEEPLMRSSASEKPSNELLGKYNQKVEGLEAQKLSKKVVTSNDSLTTHTQQRASSHSQAHTPQRAEEAFSEVSEALSFDSTLNEAIRRCEDARKLLRAKLEKNLKEA